MLGEKKNQTNLQGLCFYIYNPTRQAELKEGYLRQRHLRNKWRGTHSSMVHGRCLKTWLWHPGSCNLNKQQQPLLSWPDRTSSLLPPYKLVALVVLQG